jgi:hypothetical protein
VDLLVRYYDEARHAIRVGGAEKGDEAGDGVADASKLGPVLRRAGSPIKGVKTGRISSSVSGSGLCCICLDPVALQNVAVVAFFCSHAYHVTCLNDTSGISKASENKKKPEKDLGFRIGQGIASLYDEEDNDEEEESNSPSMRCILCTTAAEKYQSKRSQKKSTSPATTDVWGRF